MLCIHWWMIWNKSKVKAFHFSFTDHTVTAWKSSAVGSAVQRMQGLRRYGRAQIWRVVNGSIIAVQQWMYLLHSAVPRGPSLFELSRTIIRTFHSPELVWSFLITSFLTSPAHPWWWHCSCVGRKVSSRLHVLFCSSVPLHKLGQHLAQVQRDS